MNNDWQPTPPEGLESDTLQEAVIYFSDADRCEELFHELRWPNGRPRCTHCDASGRIGEAFGKIIRKTGKRLLKCRTCQKQFSATKDSVFEASHISLDKWLLATWLIANCKNGCSSYELGRAIPSRDRKGRPCETPQKTAWFMFHRIRAAMEVVEEETGKWIGPVEADATYVGGKAANMHKARRGQIIRGRGAVGKAIVHGLLQRTAQESPSRVSAAVVASDDAATLVPAVRRRVRYGATVYTDAAASYGELCITHWHKAVDHARAYAIGQIHTNGLENFWSLLKRTIGGTYISVAPFHLQRYVAEQAFRFNHRKLGNVDRFAMVLRSIGGKRLTWRKLTAESDAGFMNLT